MLLSRRGGRRNRSDASAYQAPGSESESEPEPVTATADSKSARGVADSRSGSVAGLAGAADTQGLGQGQQLRPERYRVVSAVW